MDKLTMSFYGCIGLLGIAAAKFADWWDSYQQAKRDKRLQGRNAIMARLMEHTPQPDDPCKRDECI